MRKATDTHSKGPRQDKNGHVDGHANSQVDSHDNGHDNSHANSNDHGSHQRADAANSPQRMEREVNQARARMGKTLNELTDRLSPSELLDQAVEMAREHGGDFGRNLGAQVKNNPMPIILTSIGVSWMMMSSGKSGAAQHAHDTSGTSAGKAGSGIMDSLGDTAAKSRDKASAMGDRVQGASADMKESAENARDSLVQFYRDQPLLAGSLGIAIGAAMGALVPPSDIEDNMVGEASDRSVDAAKSQAARKYDEVRESARSE